MMLHVWTFVEKTGLGTRDSGLGKKIPPVAKRGLGGISLLILVLLSPAHAAIDIQHWQTENGMRVYFVRAPELPMVDIQLVFDAGSARDGDLPGLSELTHGLLDAGAGPWGTDEIARRFEDVGAQYSAETDRDQAYVSLRSLTKPELLEQALATFIAVVTAPDFPERDFERAKRLTLVSLQGQAQDPGAIAEKAFYRAVYREHPLAHPVTGTEESARGIERKDVMAFHDRYHVAGNAVLAMVGDLDRAQAERIAERIAAGMPEGQPPAALSPVPPLDQSKTLHIPFPSAQAHVYIGEPGVQRGSPDYFPLYVGNHVLGGSGFTSRLVKEVRVQRGLSYSAYSYFLPALVKGPFIIGLQTRADQAGQAVEVSMNVLQGYIDDGPTKKELRAAIRNITGGFPLRIDSNANIVGYIAMIGYYGLPLDYLDTFNENIEQVGRAEIRKAFQQHLDPKQMVTVIVGGGEQGS